MHFTQLHTINCLSDYSHIISLLLPSWFVRGYSISFVDELIKQLLVNRYTTLSFLSSGAVIQSNAIGPRFCIIHKLTHQFVANKMV